MALAPLLFGQEVLATIVFLDAGPDPPPFYHLFLASIGFRHLLSIVPSSAIYSAPPSPDVSRDAQTIGTAGGSDREDGETQSGAHVALRWKPSTCGCEEPPPPAPVVG